MPDKSVPEIERNYAIIEEISKRGLMHQVKDVPDPNRREQFQLYLQNVALMARREDV